METNHLRRKSFEQLLDAAPPDTREHEDLQVEVTYESDLRTEGKTRLKAVKGEKGTASVTAPFPIQDGGEDAQEPEGSVQTEKQVLKNTVVLGFGFAFVFSAFTALQSLQSSLFLETGIGLHSLSVLYGFGVFSCLYGPVFVQKLTSNWTVVLAFVLFALYVSTFFFPRPYTLVPSAVLLGLVFGPLFCAQTTYLMQLVSRMAYLTPGIRDKVQQRYLRLFYFFFNSSRIWGHLVTALLLHYGGEVTIFTNRPQYAQSRTSPTPRMPVGVSVPPSMHRTSPSPTLCAEFQCGYSSSSMASSSQSSSSEAASSVAQNVTSFVIIIPSDVTLVLVCIFLGFILVGVIVVTMLLDRFDVFIYQDPMERSLFIQTLRQIRLVLIDPHMRLVLPMLIFIGLEHGFIFADFTKSYVSCALGLEAVGYTMMSMGAMNTLGALAVHQFAKHIKRPTIMAAGLIFHAGLLMVLWLWRPVRDDVAVFYVIAAGWGLCNAIWETLTMTLQLLGTRLRDGYLLFASSYVAMTYSDDWQAPFCAYQLVQMVGVASSFCYSRYLCTEVKIYILAASLLIAIVPYTLVEFRLHHRNCIQERTAVL